MGRILDMLAFWRKKDSGSRKRRGRRGNGGEAQEVDSHHRLMPFEGQSKPVPSDASGQLLSPMTQEPGILAVPALGLVTPTVSATAATFNTLELGRPEPTIPEASPDGKLVEEWLVGKGKNKRRMSEEDSGYGSTTGRRSFERAYASLPKRPRLIRDESELELATEELEVDGQPVAELSSLPPEIWSRIIDHLARDSIASLASPDENTAPSAEAAVAALEAQSQRHDLARLCKAVPKEASWRTVVIGTYGMLARVAELFETGTIDPRWVKECAIALDLPRKKGDAESERLASSTSSSLSNASSASVEGPTSLSSLLLSLSSSLVSLRLIGPHIVPRGSKVLTAQASSFRELRNLHLCGSRSPFLNHDICRLAAGCGSIHTIEVTACGADFGRSPSDDPSIDPRFSSLTTTKPLARFERLDLGTVPITAHELLWLLGSSSSTLSTLGVTLRATPQSATEVGCSSRRALLRAFDLIGRNLKELRFGESWSEPYSQGIGKWDPRSSTRPSTASIGTQGDDTVLDEVLISAPKLVSLRLDSPALYSRNLLGVLPFTLRTLELRSLLPGAQIAVGPMDVANARNQAALFGLGQVVVRGAPAACVDWRRGEAVDMLRRMGVSVDVRSK